MVYLMRSISFLNCLMTQDKGGDLWKMTEQRSHSFYDCTFFKLYIQDILMQKKYGSRMIIS